MKSDAERTPAAERMARLRRRRRDGLRPISIDIFKHEIDELVARGMLAPENRDSGAEITNALARLLNKVLPRPRR